MGFPWRNREVDRAANNSILLHNVFNLGKTPQGNKKSQMISQIAGRFTIFC